MYFLINDGDQTVKKKKQKLLSCAFDDKLSWKFLT